MRVRVVDSKVEWKSPDGQRTIWRVSLETPEKQTLVRKTFSQPIGEGIGQEKDVLEYDKEGRDGVEKFVKLVPREGGYSGGGGGRSEKDSEGMAWGNALTNAVNFEIGIKGTNATKEDVLGTAEYFFTNRPGQQPKQPEQTQLPAGQDHVPSDKEIEDLDKVTGVFPGAKYENL